MGGEIKFAGGLISSYLTLFTIQHALIGAGLSGVQQVKKEWAHSALADAWTKAQSVAVQTVASSDDWGFRHRGRVTATPETADLVDDTLAPPVPACGTQPPLGTITISHPRRPARMIPHPAVPTLMVSYEADRLFASPLHGQEFDIYSHVYIFLDGPRSDLSGAQVTFQLGGRESWSSITDLPFDLMGLADKGIGPNAVPLNTANLGAPGCHILSVVIRCAPSFAPCTRIISDALSRCLNRRRNGNVTSVQAHFNTVDRPQKVWLITTISVDDMPLLGFFLDNYLEAGVPPENFVIAVHTHNATLEASAVNATVAMLKRNHIRHTFIWEGAFNTFQKFELQESFGRRFVLQQDWVLHPDVDEHHR